MPRPPSVRRVRRVPPFLLVAVAACTSGMAMGPGDAPGAPFDGLLTVQHATVRLIRDVNVVDPASGSVESGRSVLIRDGKIESVGADLTAPAGADVVDGGGMWLMPGLVDMHVHMSSSSAEAYIRSGITTVRNMWGFSTLSTIEDRIADGSLIGPSIYSLSPGLDGPPVHWPETQLITDPADADSVVQLQYDRGYRELKIYQDLSLDVYDAIVAAAEARGMTFAGHKPSRVPLAHAIESGQRSIEHLGGYLLSGASLQEAVELTVQHGTWNCPTLEIQTQLAGASANSGLRRTVVKALYDAGARLLVGTDSGIDITEPGTSLALEMDEFVQAGVPLPAVLRMATVDAAAYLGLSDSIGRVAQGYDADLVLLSGNPLEDLTALDRPLGVHRGDGWIDMRSER